MSGSHLDQQAQAPSKSFPGAAQNDQAEVRGYYCPIDQPAASQVMPGNILAPHRQRTLERMWGSLRRCAAKTAQT